MKSMDDLFLALLQDVYFAEKRWLKSLAVLADASGDPLLRNAFNVMRFDTDEQIGRLERVFEIIGRRARGRHCDAILGIIAEADDVIARTVLGSVRDAGILAAAQAAEHYQLARYLTLMAWAERLGEHEAARHFRKTIEEERAADVFFSQVAAASVNHAAQAA
jgi:ferritin-like metal-binding protein YciE